MKENHIYDPEDIESILIHKQFNELYAEEKEFVLRFIENEEEYDSLRRTLFELQSSSEHDTWLEPDPELKRALMREFAKEKKGSFFIWLNSLFVVPEIKWYRQPSLRYALAGCLVVGIFIVLFRKDTTESYAILHPTELEQKNDIQSPAEPENKNLFADNLSQKEIPSSPKVIDMPSLKYENISEAEDLPASVDDSPNNMDQVEYKSITLVENEKNNAAPANEESSTKDESLKKPAAASDVSKDGATSVDDQIVAIEARRVSESQIQKNQTALASIPMNSETTVSSITMEDGESSFNTWPASSAPVSNCSDILDLLFTAH